MCFLNCFSDIYYPIKSWSSFIEKIKEFIREEYAEMTNVNIAAS